jgi:integration host factor subunit alpha
MALTKADLVEKILDETELHKRDAKELVDQFFEEVKTALESGRSVKLSGYGNFDLRDKKQRPGRNPKTGEEIPITARRVVTFKPGQKLKAKVEDYTDAQQR